MSVGNSRKQNRSFGIGYLLTDFANPLNNAHQNNFRYSGGINFNLGGPKMSFVIPLRATLREGYRVNNKKRELPRSDENEEQDYTLRNAYLLVVGFCCGSKCLRGLQPQR